MNEEFNVQPTPQAPQKKEESFAKEALLFVWETAKIVIISLAIIIPIRYYLVQPFFVKGASMEPNFEDGDYLLVDEISYRVGEAERGDVIVFRYPEDRSQFFIKRIVGLPGETVEIRNNRVTVYNESDKDGFTLEESYLEKGQITLGNYKVTLGADEYYVLGDNRLHSADSRRWGPVPQADIIGRALIRAWPFDRATAIPDVTY